MSSVTPESPGIYITETLSPLVNNFVPGEAIAVFAANFNRGPNIPRLITSWNQFTNLYGSFAQAVNNSYLHYAVYSFFNNNGSQCYVIAIPNSDATTASLPILDTNSGPDTVATFHAISPGVWGDTIYIAITSAGNSGRFNVVIYSGGTAANNLVEQFIDLSINPADPRYVASIVNSPAGGSSYVNISVTLPGGVYNGSVNDPALITSPAQLTGGGDGSTQPVLATAIPAALDKLTGTVINLNIPGVTNVTTLNTIVDYAEGRGDMMVIVDGPAPNFPETSAQVVSNYLAMVTGGTPLQSSTYYALYAPWIQIIDPASSIPGAVRWVPPGGSVLGVWNNTDNKVGPWQTPAGITYGQINVVNLEALWSATDLDTLNINNINAIRFVPNYFAAIMGGRTLEQGYPDRYLSVRRMLIKLEHDFTYILQPYLFAPNGPNLWLQITSVLTNYLTELTQDGSLGGPTPATSFLVTCNSSNNTQATAAAGIVNVAVAVALLSPAEFILINISQFQNTGVTTITTSV